jgi:hypothetical protein
MHEYGHTFDSRIFGVSYMLAIGIPSLISAGNSEVIPEAPFITHRKYWTELRANNWAEKYFKKYYEVNWDSSEYPLN